MPGNSNIYVCINADFHFFFKYYVNNLKLGVIVYSVIEYFLSRRSKFTRRKMNMKCKRTKYVPSYVKSCSKTREIVIQPYKYFKTHS